MLGSVFPIQAFSDQKSPLYLVCTLRYMQSEQRLGGGVGGETQLLTEQLVLLFPPHRAGTGKWLPLQGLHFPASILPESGLHSHLPLQPGSLLWTLDTNISNCVFNISLWLRWDFPGGSDGKESACNVGDLGSIPGLGRSPGAGNCNPLQSSCLGSPMDRGAWRATVHGVAKNLTQLSDYHFHFTFTLVEICVPTEFHPMKWRKNAVVPSWTCSILTLSPQHIRSPCSSSFFPFLEMGITSRVTLKATRCIWHQSGSLNNDVEEACSPTCSPAQCYYVIKKSLSNVLSTELWAKVFKVAN